MAIDADPTDRELTRSDTGVDTPGGDDDGDDLELVSEATEDGETRARRSHVAVIVAGSAVVVILTAGVGWLGYRDVQSDRAETERGLFLQAARDCALNLTTIDHTRVDADVQRILDSTTGAFHDEFRSRADPFIKVVEQAKSVSEGSVVEAGIESRDGDRAQVIIAVSVKTSVAGSSEQQDRAWRMRVGVQKTGDTAKASSVEFVP